MKVPHYNEKLQGPSNLLHQGKKLDQVRNTTGSQDWNAEIDSDSEKNPAAALELRPAQTAPKSWAGISEMHVSALYQSYFLGTTSMLHWIEVYKDHKLAIDGHDSGY